ncbi:uncharacterized protein LOC125044011 [Penaeus chinensis]|uniref:uncharacterized protein LOC125044011 n=1 Tax=Penaeus chinensis TaxID=139456 RepID=UPI001FB6A440|nr:uncharacterized protein LOC125044011 [Penaeus chinensis]
MSRFLRRLFCCCFPKVDDDVERQVVPRGGTDWTRPSDTNRSPAPLHSSGITQATTFYSITNRIERKHGIGAGITNDTSKTPSVKRPDTSVSREGISSGIKEGTSSSKSTRAPDTSDGRREVINNRVYHIPVPQVPFKPERKISVEERPAYHFSFPEAEISIRPESKRETLASKYRGHPSLSLHYGSLDLEEVIKDNGGRPLLDLHGMTVREAKEWVEYFLDLHQDLGTDSLNVVTGRGNNSTDGKAKLKPAVEKLLRELGLNFREMSKGGRFLVHL